MIGRETRERLSTGKFLKQSTRTYQEVCLGPALGLSAVVVRGQQLLCPHECVDLSDELATGLEQVYQPSKEGNVGRRGG